MIIGRKDLERVERMEKTIAAQEEELRQKDEILSYKNALVRTREEEIERWKLTICELRERIYELEGELDEKARASCGAYKENGTCRGCMHEECCLFYTE